LRRRRPSGFRRRFRLQDRTERALCDRLFIPGVEHEGPMPVLPWWRKLAAPADAP